MVMSDEKTVERKKNARVKFYQMSRSYTIKLLRRYQSSTTNCDIILTCAIKVLRRAIRAGAHIEDNTRGQTTRRETTPTHRRQS